jgi:hypothetical protein
MARVRVGHGICFTTDELRSSVLPGRNYHIVDNFFFTQKFKCEWYESYILRVVTRKPIDTEDNVKEGVQYRRIGLTDIL